MVRGVAQLAARLRGKPKRRIALRPAKPIDYGFARQTCFAALRPLVEPSHGWDEALEDGLFARQFVQGEVEILVADGGDAGWLQTRPGRGALHLIRFCLAPGFRGRGFGCFVLGQLLSRTKRRRLPILLSLARIDPGLGFYLRHGFRVTEVESHRIHLSYRPRPRARGFVPTPGMRRG